MVYLATLYFVADTRGIVIHKDTGETGIAKTAHIISVRHSVLIACIARAKARVRSGGTRGTLETVHLSFGREETGRAQNTGRQSRLILI